MFPQVFDMELYRGAHRANRLVHRITRRDAAGEVWHVSGEISRRLLNNDGVFHDAPSVCQSVLSLDAAPCSVGQIVA